MLIEKLNDRDVPIHNETNMHLNRMTIECIDISEEMHSKRRKIR